MPGPTKEVVAHLEPAALDEAVDRAQRKGEARLVRRLCLIENLYAGDTVTEAASRVGVSQPTASRWTDDWNDAGVDGLRPRTSGGRPPKLGADEREQLAAVLARYPSLATGEVRTLLETEFGVSYSNRHVARIIDEVERDSRTPEVAVAGGSEPAGEPSGGRLDAALDALEAMGSDDPTDDAFGDGDGSGGPD